MATASSSPAARRPRPRARRTGRRAGGGISSTSRTRMQSGRWPCSGDRLLAEARGAAATAEHAQAVGIEAERGHRRRRPVAAFGDQERQLAVGRRAGRGGGRAHGADSTADSHTPRWWPQRV
jgi:hypothetical protein